jgi:hypothetical protein
MTPYVKSVLVHEGLIAIDQVTYCQNPPPHTRVFYGVLCTNDVLGFAYVYRD